MKKTAFLIVFLVLVSQAAFSAPYEGTWYSNQGTDLMQIGTWTETLYGAPMYYIGSTATQTSSGGQWSCATVRTGGEYQSWLHPYGTSGSNWCDIVINFSQSVFNFHFFDGNDYTASLDYTASYRMFFNGLSYVNSSVLTFVGHGSIDGYPSYVVNVLAIGRETGGTAGVSHNGTIDYLKMNITDPKPVVPIPAALWIFGSGLVGLIGLRKRVAGA